MNINVFIVFVLQPVEFAVSPHDNMNIRLIGNCMYRFVCEREGVFPVMDW